MSIFVYNDMLLTSDECDAIRDFSSGLCLTQSTVTSNDENGNPVRSVGEYRTNHNLRLSYDASDLIGEVYRRVSSIVSLPVENIEMEVNKYHVGEYFLPHYDFLPPEWIEGTGGQRLYSCVIYLNDDFEGGQTNFPNISHIVQPVKGNAIVWRNCYEDSTISDHLSLHESVSVTSGEKWALILWIRESAFISKHFQTTS